jgi:hypothetical protein
MLSTIQLSVFCLLPKDVKNKGCKSVIVLLFCMCVNLGSNIKRTLIEDVWEQGAEENIWTQEGWSARRLEKTA